MGKRNIRVYTTLLYTAHGIYSNELNELKYLINAETYIFR